MWGRVQDVRSLALVIGCKIGKFPSSYLGLPLGSSFKSKMALELVVESREEVGFVESPFALKKRRLTLIKSLLASMPNYLLSLF